MLNKAYEECDGDEDMISPAQACLMFVDWTDPQKTVYALLHLLTPSYADFVMKSAAPLSSTSRA